MNFILVRVCVYEILDLLGISLVSGKTNFLVSEVGEWLLGSSTFFLFSGCGRAWEFLMLLVMGEMWWGGIMRTLYFGGAT